MLLRSESVTHPQGGYIFAAVNWIQTTLLGSAATSIAIIAVAALGLSMVWGRFDIRAAGRVAVGAFFVFGAPLLALQLSAILRGSAVAEPEMIIAPSPSGAPPIIPKDAPVQDPYAGAAVPQLQP
jgi:type IV secretory pathway VirB2 component (pilin)